METMSLADAKNRLSELVSSVSGTWERVLITKHGRPAAILMSPDDLESILETLEVLSDPDTMAAIEEAEKPDAITYTGEEMAEIMAARFGTKA